jgi:hypothetical protein
MRTAKTFDSRKILEGAKTGHLKGAELRKAITRADDLGLKALVGELKLFLVSATTFAGDDAPKDVRDRVAKGMSALTAMGRTLSKTKQMLKKNGVIETLNRIGQYPASSTNFEKLCDAGLENLTAEAIVLDYPQLFSEKTVEVSRARLRR